METQNPERNRPERDPPIAASIEGQLRAIAAIAAPYPPVEQLSPAALAYLGDAVYELLVRTNHLLPAKRISDYHRQVVEDVRAESQARRLAAWQIYLSDAERDLLRRGRNAASKGPRRLAPEIYQQATSLETLVGYLFLSDPQRLIRLFAAVELDLAREGESAGDRA